MNAQPSLLDWNPPKPIISRYPDHAGFKVLGASEEAANLVENTSYKGVWMRRCIDLYSIRPDWTAEEGINHYVRVLGLDPRIVDKGLRPRFTDLSNSTPTRKAFLYKAEQRIESTSRIKPHVYRRVA